MLNFTFDAGIPDVQVGVKTEHTGIGAEYLRGWSDDTFLSVLTKIFYFPSNSAGATPLTR